MRELLSCWPNLQWGGKISSPCLVCGAFSRRTSWCDGKLNGCWWCKTQRQRYGGRWESEWRITADALATLVWSVRSPPTPSTSTRWDPNSRSSSSLCRRQSLFGSPQQLPNQSWPCCHEATSILVKKWLASNISHSSSPTISHHRQMAYTLLHRNC